MATLIDTTNPAGAGTPSRLVFGAFRSFASSLPRLISDERDLSGCAGHDPAVDAWFRAAEQSRLATLVALEAVLACGTNTRADRAMRTLAVLFRSVMLSGDAAQVWRLVRLAEGSFARLDLPQDAHRMICGVVADLRTYVSLETPEAERPEAAGLTVGCGAEQPLIGHMDAGAGLAAAA